MVPKGVSGICYMSLVSTIIPVYNRPQMVVRAVESVLAQTYRPIEVIVVDDGSTDQTGDVLDDLAAEHAEVQVIHKENEGQGAARETGRQAAEGDFIQYLDSDDRLLPPKFELQVQELRQNPDCGICYGKTRFYRQGEDPSDEAWKRTGERIEKLFPSMLVERWWGTSTPLYTRAVTDEAGPWSNVRNSQDWEYDCRIATKDVKLAYVPKFVSEEFAHAGARVTKSTPPTDKIRNMVAANKMIMEHARTAGVPLDCDEMRATARRLFRLCRRAGAAGLPERSKEIFELALEFTEPWRRKGLDFRLYRFMTHVLGWTLTGRLACWLR